MANAELVRALKQGGLEALAAHRKSRPKEGVDLAGAILPKLDLRGAPLAEADLRGAYLVECDLGDADLRMANLSGANLDKVNLAGAIFFRTHLSGVDLNRAEGVERIRFDGPCDIGLGTIASVDDLAARKALLRGVGLPADFSAAVAALPLDPRSSRTVFVAHVRKDGALARWFGAKLEAAGMRVFPYPIDKDGADRPFKDILHQIRREDWVVFLASEAAMTNPLVDIHVEKVIQARKLQPVALDRYLSNEWEHAMRNDMMQLKIVRFYDADTDELRAEAVDRLIAALRRGLAEHL